MEHGTRKVVRTAISLLSSLVLAFELSCAARRDEGPRNPPAPSTAQSALGRALALPCEDEVRPERKGQYERVLVSADALDNRLLHDCQKLMTGPGQYGPQVAILVAANVADRIRQYAAKGVVIADIINYDTVESYDPLNIKPRPELNCLWIQGDPNNPAGWQADIRQGSGCVYETRLTSPPRLPGLRVDTIRYATVMPDSARGTARWEWDSVSGTQFIGIDCGVAWCEIGRPGFHGTQTRPGDGIGLADEQYLAADDNAAHQTGRPSHVWGRIEPFAVLGTAKQADYAKAPLRVARIILRLDGPDPHGADNTHVHALYRAKYSLRGDTTDLFMKYQRGTYLVATDTSANAANWTRLVRCDWPHAAVGAARWRWAATDEALWLACSDGCCSTPRIGVDNPLP